MTGAPLRPRVVLGVEGAQMPANAIRGIGRWTSEYVMALVHSRPDLVAAVSVDPVLPVPAFVSRLPATVDVVTAASPPRAAAGERLVFHSFSALEDLELERVWPRWAQHPDVGLVTTVYDMIPLLFPGDYFQGALKHVLTARYELHRQADAVIGISRTTVDDACRILGLEPHRCFVAYGAVSPLFRPHPAGRDGALAELRELGVRPGFLLSIGNVDPRKNVAALLRAYAALRPDLRAAHQLVVTCSQGDRRHLEGLAALVDELGLTEHVLLTSFVTDAVMVRLYQACELMVFPSLYEGLGLPLIEAMRCGALAVGSDVGSMREIVRTVETRFDPSSVPAIAEVLTSLLTDGRLASRLRDRALHEGARFDWSTSLAAAEAAYELAARGRS